MCIDHIEICFAAGGHNVGNTALADTHFPLSLLDIHMPFMNLWYYFLSTTQSYKVVTLSDAYAHNIVAYILSTPSQYEKDGA
jgi:hypothetical protein